MVLSKVWVAMAVPDSLAQAMVLLATVAVMRCMLIAL
jgi:hypothetical protein